MPDRRDIIEGGLMLAMVAAFWHWAPLLIEVAR